MKKNLQLLGLLAFSLLGSISATHAQGSTSVVGSDGFLRVNGQKFFPVGYYAEGLDGYTAHNYAATTLAVAGFNTMYTENNQMNVADYSTFFNRCNTLGVKNLISFYGDVDSSVLNSFKTFPSLLSWFIADDGDTRYTAAAIKARHDSVRALDPNHVTGSALTTVVFSTDGNLQQYTAATNVSSLEWYPVREDDPISSDVKFTYQPVSRIAAACTQQGKSGMAILEPVFTTEKRRWISAFSSDRKTLFTAPLS